jgi:hypothetical protein
MASDLSIKQLRSSSHILPRTISKQARPQVFLLDIFTAGAAFREKLRKRGILQFQRVAIIEHLGSELDLFAFTVSSHVLQPSSYGDIVDGFFDGSVNYVEPDSRFLLLTYAMYPGDGLQLEGCIYQWFAQEDVTCIHKIQSGRMSSGVQQKALDSWILLESFDSARLVYGAKANPEVG